MISVRNFFPLRDINRAFTWNQLEYDICNPLYKNVTDNFKDFKFFITFIIMHFFSNYIWF